MFFQRGFGLALLGMALAMSTDTVMAQQTASPAAAVVSKGQATLDQAAKDGKFTFVLFYKTNDAATQAMAATLKAGLASRYDTATAVNIVVGQADEKPIVDRFDVSRAPMPLTIAIAPNGAITGMFPQRLTAEGIENSFVTPTMTRCMKSLQEGKIVFVAVQGTGKAASPAAIADFQADPHFKDRMATYSFAAADPLEGKFVKQLQMDNGNIPPMTTALLAPPGVLVGKFEPVATKDEIAAALARAGKCCDDPNCKHHQQQPQSTAPRTASQPTAPRR